MSGQNVLSLQSIVQRRKSPGLLLFNAQGKLLFWNSLAQQILHYGNGRGKLLQKIGKALRNTKKTLLIPTPSVHSPTDPIIQTTFPSNGRIYALRAFLLDHQPKGRDSVVAVLLEQISPSRVDFLKAQRLFGLSRREIEAIQGLLFGRTDKEIASTLELSHETVRTYLKTIRAKLGVSTRTAILHKLLLH